MPQLITAETLELERTIICNDAANRCEDCPVTNPDPPSASDCPNFELLGSIPTCTKEDTTRRMIDGGGRSTGIGSVVFPNLVELVETNWRLPDVDIQS